MPANLRESVVYADPKTHEDRQDVATACVRKLNIEIPALLDNPENTTERAWTGWPDRLYVVNRDGRIAFKTTPGPFGFKVAPLEEALKKTLSSSTELSHSRYTAPPRASTPE